MLVATRLNFATESAANCGAFGVCPGGDPAAFAATQSSLPASAFTVTPVSSVNSVGQTCVTEQVSALYPYTFQFLPWTVTLQSLASYSNCTSSSSGNTSPPA
jgi:hypothetical protein